VRKTWRGLARVEGAALYLYICDELDQLTHLLQVRVLGGPRSAATPGTWRVDLSLPSAEWCTARAEWCTACAAKPSQAVGGDCRQLPNSADACRAWACGGPRGVVTVHHPREPEQRQTDRGACATL